MPSRPRDSQRQRLYDAQSCLPDYEQNVFGTVEQTQKWLDEIIAARWFRTRWRLGEVPIVPGGRGARSHGGSISLGQWARNPPIVLHELAHEIMRRATGRGRSEYASHGPEFAAVYLFLVKMVMGKPEADKLRASFVAHRVKHRAAGAVPAPRYDVPTQAEQRQRRRAAANRPIRAADRQAAAETIRRAVKAGDFGASGTKARAAALMVARTIERNDDT